MNTTWKIAKLGEILTQMSRQEVIDPNKQYRLLGIRLDGAGPFLRETKLGSEISVNMLSRVESGDFIYSRLFAWRGAFGIIDSGLKGCYVSGEFPTFATNPNCLDLNFLLYWFRLPTTLKAVAASCTGSTPLTRNRFKKEFFLALDIPLPPLEEQQRIVARIEKLATKIGEAHHLREQSVQETEALLDSAKVAILGEDHLKDFRVRLAEADVHINRESRDPFRSDPLGVFTYIDISSVGKGPSVITAGKEIPTKEAPSRARRVIRKNDLIISTVRPNLRTFAKVGEELDNQICSTGFAVITCGPSLIQDFLLHQFCSPLLVDQCVGRTTGGHYPAINDANFRNIVIIAPPLPEQRRIIAELDEMQKKIDALKRLQAETAAELKALLPAILDRAFKGDL